MTEESQPCFILTGTGNKDVVLIKRCVHCVWGGAYMCDKFNVPIMNARGMGGVPLCTGIGVEYVCGLSTDRGCSDRYSTCGTTL